MEGVTTAIVAFIFACLIWPHLVKNKPQFYAALGLVLLVILLDAIGHFQGTPGALHSVTYVFAALLQIMAVLLLVLCAGGLTVRELAGEVRNTAQTFRRGGEDKPTLVPLTGQAPLSSNERSGQTPRKPTLSDQGASIPLQ